MSLLGLNGQKKTPAEGEEKKLKVIARKGFVIQVATLENHEEVVDLVNLDKLPMHVILGAMEQVKIYLASAYKQ